jgi:hypothetical protein
MDFSFAQGAVNRKQGRATEIRRQTPRSGYLAFDEDGVREPAQPAFTAGIAKKPTHPAKRAGDGAIFVAGKN